MEKGIAVPMILLLLVGTLVTGVTVYYTYRSLSGSSLSEFECRGMMVSWCLGCKNMGYSEGSAMDTQLSECAGRYWGMSHSDCDAEKDCSSFLPGGNGGGTVTTTTTIAVSLCSQAPGNIGCRTIFNCVNNHGGSCYSSQYPNLDCSTIDPCCCIL